ncbi:hypothetical protein F5Y17DRAFT_459114 [Xylariaceae sp. FL0594]|nr:hypothetical protein F5Y17DRAFT_459114 [Xylariaceae sp. FL0594]
MNATRVLRQAQAVAHGAERTPLIRFIGKRNIPSNIDHTPQPHPASPTGSLPPTFNKSNGNSHASFSSYRDSAQQHGPLRKSIGAQPASKLGPIQPPKGQYFDRNELPARFRRTPLTLAEIEAIETGGAALFG